MTDKLDIRGTLDGKLRFSVAGDREGIPELIKLLQQFAPQRAVSEVSPLQVHHGQEEPSRHQMFKWKGMLPDQALLHWDATSAGWAWGYNGVAESWAALPKHLFPIELVR